MGSRRQEVRGTASGISIIYSPLPTFQSMYTLITLFYISFLIIVLMVWNKRREIRTGHPSMASRLGVRTDHFFQSAFHAVGKVLSYINKHTFIALAQWVAFHILVHVRKVYVQGKHHFISNPHGKKMIDAVRGRGEVKSHGASFYLRRISKIEPKK